MFGDPSDPPPDGQGRPLRLFTAALWMVGTHYAAMWVLLLVSAVRSVEHDLMISVICQALTYLLGLYLMLRVHAPNSRIRDFVGAHRPHFAFVLLAPIIGAAAPFPAGWLQDQLFVIFPQETAPPGWIDTFHTLPLGRRLAVAVAAVAVGPLVEELIFRGAAFTSLLDRHRPRVVTGVTALFFALIHLQPVVLPLFFTMGLILGHLRWASGSLIPAVLLHMAFNAVPFVYLVPSSAPFVDSATPSLYAAVGLAVVVAGVAGVHLLGRRLADSGGVRPRRNV